MAVEKINITRQRRKQLDHDVTPAELTELRSAIGSLGWVARQTRADLAYVQSRLAQRVSRATVADLLEANQAVDQAIDFRDDGVHFPASNLDPDKLTVFVCADAAFAGQDCEETGPIADGTKSQYGFVLGVTDGRILGEGEAPVHILEWSSATVKRICRATLAAEGYAVTEGAEAAEWVRYLLTEMQYPNVLLKDIDEKSHGKQAVWFSDARSLVDMISKDAGRPSDKRLRITLAALKQTLNQPSTYCKWIDTLNMLADGLTKEGVEKTALLREVMARGVWSHAQTDKAKAVKEASRAGRAHRAQKRRDLKATLKQATVCLAIVVDLLP